MKIFKTQDRLSTEVSRDQSRKIPGIDSIYLQAIENADGVPYQLLFLPQTQEGYYLRIGSGIKELLGIPPEDFTETLFLGMIEQVFLLSGDAHDDILECRRKFISGEIKSLKAEILVRTAEGNKKWIRDSSVPLFDEETGRVTGALGIFYDITGNRLSLERLDKLTKKEEECDSLKAAFLHNISHEIRTPLNAIVGFSTLLGEHLRGPDLPQEYLDTITSNADHLLEVIDDILEMAKIEARTVKIIKGGVNLSSVIRRVYNQYRDEAGRKGISLQFATFPDSSDSEIITDGYKLTKALANLVGNSVKFTGEGQVQFGCSIRDKKIEFYVSDTGIGIPEGHQAGIFSRFYQADSSSSRTYGGTGLGLAIAKAYVELLGGEIWFTSAQGKGSVFRFTLPDEREN